MPDKKTVLFVGQNLVFLPRIQSAASALEYQVKQTRTESDFWDAYGEIKPALVLVDLEGDSETWPRIIEGIKREQNSNIRVVAFGPHADVASMEQARQLGCDEVLTKGAFTRDLSKVLYGSIP
jgi:ActR/RegA family two-component response regulator